MMRRAIGRSAWLSALFLAVYTGSNWLAAQQPAVGAWYFEWERRIPFWPIMIVPYLSIDAFFVAAPFLFRDRGDLRAYSRRVTAAILVAGACFVCMPLRFAFERPAADGWAGTLVQAFASLDRPFNLFPSLHVALAVLLAEVYLRRTTGLLRGVCAVWFALIGVSTLFTYQHHIVDVAGGAALAVLVCHAIPGREVRRERCRNLRVAAYYLLGAAVCAAMAGALQPWGAALLWPAASFTLVAWAYAGAGSAVFRKSDGAIPLATRVVLGPALAGQRLSLAWYRRQCRAFDEVAPRVWIGRRLDDAEAADAVDRGVAAVLDLSAELDESRAFTRLAYRNIPVLDLTAPTLAQLDAAVRFIERHRRAGVVYVHCKIGYSRSVAAVAAWLLATGAARTTDDAIASVRRARRAVIVRPEVVAVLRAFESRSAMGRGRQVRQRVPAAMLARAFAAAARLLCGAARWEGCQPDSRQRIYFANHTSHLDFPAVWCSLPAAVRANARPIAARDYWNRDRLRRYLARQVFRAVLVDRGGAQPDREFAVARARRTVDRAARALAAGASLIIFPEGTRGDGVEVAPFKSGLYHLCRLRPDVELVPVYLENMHRILPRGEALPVPVAGSVTFGRPIRLQPGESKQAFLTRARRALLEVRQPCTYSPTLLSRAS